VELQENRQKVMMESLQALMWSRSGKGSSGSVAEGDVGRVRKALQEKKDLVREQQRVFNAACDGVVAVLEVAEREMEEMQQRKSGPARVQRDDASSEALRREVLRLEAQVVALRAEAAEQRKAAAEAAERSAELGAREAQRVREEQERRDAKKLAHERRQAEERACEEQKEKEQRRQEEERQADLQRREVDARRRRLVKFVWKTGRDGNPQLDANEQQLVQRAVLDAANLGTENVTADAAAQFSDTQRGLVVAVFTDTGAKRVYPEELRDFCAMQVREWERDHTSLLLLAIHPMLEGSGDPVCRPTRRLVCSAAVAADAEAWSEQDKNAAQIRTHAPAFGGPEMPIAFAAAKSAATLALDARVTLFLRGT
jgi:hypothetical protein